MKKNGFTLVELLAVIVILVIILAIAVPGISNMIKSSAMSAFKSDAKMVLKAIDYKKLENEAFNPLLVTKENMQEQLGISDENYAQVSFIASGNGIKVIIVGTGKWNGLTAYGVFKNMRVVNSEEYDETPPVITVLGSNPLTISANTPYTDPGATALDDKDGNVTSSIVTTGTVNISVIGTYTITYTVADKYGNTATATRTVNVIREGNEPVLATGMTPVKWNGSAWVNTTAADPDWYSYATAYKKWANVKTADGSMWVWIPRYIYKISTGWHSNATGTMNVLFSTGTDDTRGGTVTLDTGTTANASNNKWTNHPAFTFGTTELMGIWVAKFESSGTLTAIDSKPNVVSSLCGYTIGDMFTAARNMETNSRYGWGTSGTNLDTHMMKNTEWGAVAYLSRSTYGKNAEVWINNNNDVKTGCAGSSVSATSSSTCYTYDTANGQQASTTGNIYGVYDMSGARYEAVAAYVNNGNANLTTYGNSVVTSASKYKNIYPITTDTSANNYAGAVAIKGDALYETSNSYTGSTSWFADYSEMSQTTMPWISRGGIYTTGGNSGIFAFRLDTTGAGNSSYTIRTIIAVGTGL